MQMSLEEGVWILLWIFPSTNRCRRGYFCPLVLLIVIMMIDAACSSWNGDLVWQKFSSVMIWYVENMYHLIFLLWYFYFWLSYGNYCLVYNWAVINPVCTLTGFRPCRCHPQSYAKHTCAGTIVASLDTIPTQKFVSTPVEERVSELPCSDGMSFSPLWSTSKKYRTLDRAPRKLYSQFKCVGCKVLSRFWD